VFRKRRAECTDSSYPGGGDRVRPGKPIQHLLCLILLQIILSSPAWALLQPATPAPRFALNNMHGGLVEVNSLQGRKLVVLYFFDIESQSSLECLSAMDQLAREHPTELVVYGITASPPELVNRYLSNNRLTIQLLRATPRVRELYQARQVLPVGCIIGQGFRVVRHYQGGGAGFKSAMFTGIRRELPGKAHLAGDPAPAPARKSPAKGKGPGNAQVSEVALPALKEAPVPEEKTQPNKLGEIIDESRWAH
jgi:peroxiredoxin